MSKEWRRVIGGLILAGGFLIAGTLVLFVTHPCNPSFVPGQGQIPELDDCGAVVPAIVVSGLSLILGLSLLLSARKSGKSSN